MTPKTGIKCFARRDAALGFLFVSLLSAPLPASAFLRTQHTIELGPEIYQGSDATVMRPEISMRGSLATRYDIQDWFALVGRFTGQFFTTSTPGFNAIPDTTYFGFGVGYNPSVRVKLGFEGLVPYLEAGGLASFNFISLQTAPVGVSPNQLALKFGYTAGIGIDWFSDSSGGNWGLGLALNYFSIFAGPAILDYASGPIGGSGFRADLHISLSLER